MSGEPVSPPPTGKARRVLCVTGRLAEPALRRVVAGLGPEVDCEVRVLGITVAALMTTDWIGRQLSVPEGIELVLLPGLVEGDVGELARRFGVSFEKGPRDLHDIPTHFGRPPESDYGAWDIEIAAEINNAPRMSRREILEMARHYLDTGADLIDVGCTPGVAFPELGEVVGELRSAGMRVSVDSFDAGEIRTAVEAGAELVLSLNPSNVGVARDLAGSPARVVLIPEAGGALSSLDPGIEKLEEWGVAYLIDPILEPIGFGFMASLERYAEARRRYPDSEMLMGIGNLTELTAADSTGVNALLVAICQELGIRTVLTTEVIGWARGAVREVDIARRLMYDAVTRRRIPKDIDDRLVTLRDGRVLSFSAEEIEELQRGITDANFRIFADSGGVTVLNDELLVRGTDIQEIFASLGVDEPTHAFYLGQELARASLAVILGKTYRQEGALDWGYLTPSDDRPSTRVRLTGRAGRRRGPSSPS